MSRLSRYADRRRWKPYRVERRPEPPPIPPEGELWAVDAAGNPTERIEQPPVDREAEEP